MKVNGSMMPVTAFSVFNRNGIAEVQFYENVREVTAENSQDGSVSTSWDYDLYILNTPWRNKLEDDIEANYDTWLEAAKRAEEERNPEDIHQMRADIDFFEICLNSMSGVAMMSLETPQTDPDILEKAQKYYPSRWDKNRLRRLVLLQQLMQEDYKTITGEEFTA